jgi:hypothetical protein
MLISRCRVPNIIAASIAISVFGFFSGPLFAAVSRTATARHTYLWPRLHIPGNVCRIKVVSIGDEIYRALHGIRGRANGWFPFPNNHGSPQYQVRRVGAPACSGVVDCSHCSLLVRCTPA